MAVTETDDKAAALLELDKDIASIIVDTSSVSSGTEDC